MKTENWVIPFLKLISFDGVCPTLPESILQDIESALPPSMAEYLENNREEERQRLLDIFQDDMEIVWLLLPLTQSQGMTLTNAIDLYVPKLSDLNATRKDYEERRLRHDAKRKWISKTMHSLSKDPYPLVRVCKFGEVTEPDHVVWTTSDKYGSMETVNRRKWTKLKPNRNEVVYQSTTLLDEMVSSVKPGIQKLSENLNLAFRD